MDIEENSQTKFQTKVKAFARILLSGVIASVMIYMLDYIVVNCWSWIDKCILQNFAMATEYLRIYCLLYILHYIECLISAKHYNTNSVSCQLIILNEYIKSN